MKQKLRFKTFGNIVGPWMADISASAPRKPCRSISIFYTKWSQNEAMRSCWHCDTLRARCHGDKDAKLSVVF